MCRFWLPILRHIHGMPRMCYRHPNGMRSLLKCLGSNGQFQNALCNSEGFTYEVTPCFWERPNLSTKNDRSSTSVFAQTFNTRDFTWFHHQNIKLKGRWPGPTWQLVIGGFRAGVPLGSRKPMHLFTYIHMCIYIYYVTTSTKIDSRKNPQGSRSLCHFCWGSLNSVWIYVHVHYF